MLAFWSIYVGKSPYFAIPSTSAWHQVDQMSCGVSSLPALRLVSETSWIKHKLKFRILQMDDNRRSNHSKSNKKESLTENFSQDKLEIRACRFEIYFSPCKIVPATGVRMNTTEWSQSTLGQPYTIMIPVLTSSSLCTLKFTQSQTLYTKVHPIADVLLCTVSKTESLWR